MPKNVFRKAIRRKLTLTPITALFVIDELGECSLDQIIADIFRQFSLSEAEFQQACGYQFVPTCIAPLLERNWLLRKWDGKHYTFRITVTGKSELEKY